MAHPNEELIQRFYTAFADQDGETISARLVEMMRGTIGARSTPEAGSGIVATLEHPALDPPRPGLLRR